MAGGIHSLLAPWPRDVSLGEGERQWRRVRVGAAERLHGRRHVCFGQSDPIVRAHLMSEAIRRMMSMRSGPIRRNQAQSYAIRPNQA